VVAALVEQRNDERGIIWPAAIAPYDVHVLALTGGSPEVEALATSVAEELSAAGHSVLLDDRDARPGEKFADADLLGCPRRVTVGRKSPRTASTSVPPDTRTGGASRGAVTTGNARLMAAKKRTY
jgi:prolyl-tRNA synthetase